MASACELPPVHKHSFCVDYLPHWDMHLGSGTFGAVYTCTRRADNTRFAVKVVKASQHAWQEARMHHYLTLHAPEHVVNLVDVYDNELSFSDGCVDAAAAPRERYVLLVMELMQGGDLLHRISELGDAFNEKTAR